MTSDLERRFAVDIPTLPPRGTDIDVPRMRKTLEHVTAHPEEWDQGMWAQQTACGTTACFAGHVVADAGYDFLWGLNGETNPDGSYNTDAWYASVDGQKQYISVVAARLLGLSLEQAESMFSVANGLGDLWELASRYTNGEIVIPEEFK